MKSRSAPSFRAALVALVVSLFWLTAMLHAQVATLITSGATLPATCATGNLWAKTGGGDGLYVCIAGVWVGPLTAAGGGDVTGPGSSTDHALVRFDGATGTVIQDGVITQDDTGVLTFPDDVRQTFNPGANNEGLNVGSIAGDPATPLNGGLWYNSTANELTARINGSNVALGAGGSGITQLTGDVTAGPGSGSQAATIANDAVTYAKMQDVSAGSTLLGRGDSGSGDVEEITLGSGLSMSGTTLSASGGGSGDVELFDRNFGTVTIANTNTEQTLYSVAIPGGTLGTNGMLVISLGGTYRNGSGSARGFTPRVKLGATTIWGTASGNVMSSNNTITRPWRLDIILASAGATNAQKMIARWTLSSLEAATVAGFGGLVNISTSNQPFYGTGAEDTTGALTLEITWQHSATHADLTISREMVVAELIP